MAEAGLVEGPDGVTRCAWPGNLPDYLHYHDHEWGRPVADDRRLFEKICLEGFQSGLSWLTILQEARELSRRLRQFRVRQGRRIHRGRRRATAAGRRHHPPPRQDRLHHQQRPPRAGDGCGGRLARRMVLAFRARCGRAAEEGRPRASACQPDHRGFRAHLEGTEEARVDLRRADDGLCLHAGDGPGQRPHRGLRVPGGDREGTGEVQTAGFKLPSNLLVAALQLKVKADRVERNRPDDHGNHSRERRVDDQQTGDQRIRKRHRLVLAVRGRDVEGTGR